MGNYKNITDVRYFDVFWHFDAHYLNMTLARKIYDGEAKSFFVFLKVGTFSGRNSSMRASQNKPITFKLYLDDIMTLASAIKYAATNSTNYGSCPVVKFRSSDDGNTLQKTINLASKDDPKMGAKIMGLLFAEGNANQYKVFAMAPRMLALALLLERIAGYGYDLMLDKKEDKTDCNNSNGKMNLEPIPFDDDFDQADNTSSSTPALAPALAPAAAPVSAPAAAPATATSAVQEKDVSFEW